jgi:hypothetical protein
MSNNLSKLASVVSFACASAACAPESPVEVRRWTTSHVTTTAHDGAAGFDVLVIAGQSNAVGQGYGDAGDDPALAELDSRIFQIGRRGADDRKVIPAGDPLHFWTIDATWPGKGFSMPLARRYAKSSLAAGRNLLIVPAAFGGSVISQWDVNTALVSNKPDGTQTSLYIDMKERIARALAQPGENHLVGVLWQQGESDVIALAGGTSMISNATTYGEHVAAMAGALRADFASQGCFPFLVGEMSREWTQWPGLDPGAIALQKSAVTAALNSKVPTIGCSSFITSDGLTGNPDQKGWDKIHFDAHSQVILAQRYLARLTGPAAPAADRDHVVAFVRSIYSGLVGHDPTAPELDALVDEYNPSIALGCRVIAQDVVRASPGRAPAEAATSATDAALTDYIQRLYRVLLSGLAKDNTSTIAGWRVTGQLSMDQLDGIFLGDAIFASRCVQAGLKL